MPLSAAAAAGVAERPDKWTAILGGGDDYQILFATAAAKRDAISSMAMSVGATVMRIGELTADPEIRMLDVAGAQVEFPSTGYTHF